MGASRGPFVNPYRAIAAAVAASCLAGCAGFEARDPSTWFSRTSAGREAPAPREAAAPGAAGLDARSRALAAEALTRALDGPPGRTPVPWTTDDGVASGQVVPGTPFVSGGRACRDYVNQIHTDGRTREERGVACRGADGAWTPT